LTVSPAILFPALPPAFAEAVHDVRAVGMDVNATTSRHRGETLGDCLQLHALVRRVRRAAGDHALVVSVDDDGGPAARPGIARAGTVREDNHVGGSKSGRGWGAGGASRQAVSCQ